MTAEQIIAIVFSCIVGILLIFFLIPAFVSVGDSLGELVCDFVSRIKDAFIETAEEWKNIFKRWTE